MVLKPKARTRFRLTASLWEAFKGTGFVNTKTEYWPLHWGFTNLSLMTIHLSGQSSLMGS